MIEAKLQQITYGYLLGADGADDQGWDVCAQTNGVNSVLEQQLLALTAFEKDTKIEGFSYHGRLPEDGSAVYTRYYEGSRRDQAGRSFMQRDIFLIDWPDCRQLRFDPATLFQGLPQKKVYYKVECPAHVKAAFYLEEFSKRVTALANFSQDFLARWIECLLVCEKVYVYWPDFELETFAALLRILPQILRTQATFSSVPLKENPGLTQIQIVANREGPADAGHVGIPEQQVVLPPDVSLPLNVKNYVQELARSTLMASSLQDMLADLDDWLDNWPPEQLGHSMLVRVLDRFVDKKAVKGKGIDLLQSLSVYCKKLKKNDTELNINMLRAEVQNHLANYRADTTEALPLLISIYEMFASGPSPSYKQEQWLWDKLRGLLLEEKTDLQGLYIKLLGRLLLRLKGWKDYNEKSKDLWNALLLKPLQRPVQLDEAKQLITFSHESPILREKVLSRLEIDGPIDEDFRSNLFDTIEGDRDMVAFLGNEKLPGTVGFTFEVFEFLEILSLKERVLDAKAVVNKALSNPNLGSSVSGQNRLPLSILRFCARWRQADQSGDKLHKLMTLTTNSALIAPKGEEFEGYAKLYVELVVMAGLEAPPGPGVEMENRIRKESPSLFLNLQDFRLSRLTGSGFKFVETAKSLELDPESLAKRLTRMAVASWNKGGPDKQVLDLICNPLLWENSSELERLVQRLAKSANELDEAVAGVSRSAWIVALANAGLAGAMGFANHAANIPGLEKIISFLLGEAAVSCSGIELLECIPQLLIFAWRIQSRYYASSNILDRFLKNWHPENAKEFEVILHTIWSYHGLDAFELGKKRQHIGKYDELQRSLLLKRLENYNKMSTDLNSKDFDPLQADKTFSSASSEEIRKAVNYLDLIIENLFGERGGIFNRKLEVKERFHYLSELLQKRLDQDDGT